MCSCATDGVRVVGMGALYTYMHARVHTQRIPTPTCKHVEHFTARNLNRADAYWDVSVCTCVCSEREWKAQIDVEEEVCMQRWS